MEFLAFMSQVVGIVVLVVFVLVGLAGACFVGSAVIASWFGGGRRDS